MCVGFENDEKLAENSGGVGETTELVAVFGREKKRGCDSSCKSGKPQTPSCGTFQDCGLMGSGQG